ncbi:threonine--tRNA ligase [Candidatus Peregrinibacteria bacterium]|nr:threonine--tRNA ligase [Candidatus Peregrinibacteria bacterium]
MPKENKKVDLDAMRHSCSHVLAQAVLQMFPEAKLGIGPTIEDGFYYDFELPRTLIPEDLPILEKKMKQIIKQDQKFLKKEVSPKEAIKFLKKADQKYKIELVKEFAKSGEKITFYENVMPQDNKPMFVDLCEGPHLDRTGQIGAFKLLKIAGAYWRGDEKNPMLQRIYGTCFHTKEELDKYLKKIEEAKKRDHRKLGKELDLFSFHEDGPGFPFFHPKGMILINQLLEYWHKEHKEAGYGLVSTPIILRESLWHQSGHYDNYKEHMYFTHIDDEGYAIKPMNCPGGMLIYKERTRSYRHLPLRWAELGLVHRHEKSGVLHGLFRVRSFTQDDAHIFCTEEQIKDELKGVLRLFEKMYAKFGFEYMIELSTRPEKSIGSDEMWDLSEKTMHEVLKEEKLDYEINEGDGAFYGPKFDFHIADCLGRTWQCGTLQLDFSMPERFELEYIGEDGNPHRPVMLHRVVYGSIERFMGILIEHYGGAFPAWIAPVQAIILPVSDKFNDYAKKAAEKLYEKGIRYEIDDSSETLGKKIRNAELLKIPFMLVVGEKEQKGNTVAVRDYATKKQKVMKVDEFIKMASL